MTIERRGCSASSSRGPAVSRLGGEISPRRSAIAMLRRTERPMNVTRRLVASAARIAWSMRSMLEANDVTITRPAAAATTSCSGSMVESSDAVRPGSSAFVESPSMASTPARPRAPRRSRSQRRFGLACVLSSL